MNGARRESHSVALQWCSRDQSKTTTLIGVTIHEFHVTKSAI